MSDRVLVTGAAGFIGSHVSRRLLERGTPVRGVDCFTDYYPREVKEANVARLKESEGFEFVEADLASADTEPLLRSVSSVCHLAAQAGVRSSWGSEFEIYLSCNVLATQRLLEAARDMVLARFVYASSSSVYGETRDLPMREDGRARPVSPYGVTKLAAEHLAVLYHRSYGVPTVSLRYFTVYGPRQRPDMAFHRFILAGLTGEPIYIYGDGEQTRDFTFVDDVVEATIRALDGGPPGEVLNIGGGSRVTLNEAISTIERLLSTDLDRRYEGRARGDVTDTLAESEKAERELGFRPRTPLEEGLAAQCEWMREVVTESR
ncbi:MAG: NAD-dependent epimerase/dehydratase family protein [Candidatus Eisenbacteria bacterium]|nr:NAD-dependent epimerase/dehydratase family protein [Candidatus Eisenbacteria bacterium]